MLTTTALLTYWQLKWRKNWFILIFSQWVAEFYLVTSKYVGPSCCQSSRQFELYVVWSSFGPLFYFVLLLQRHFNLLSKSQKKCWICRIPGNEVPCLQEVAVSIPPPGPKFKLKFLVNQDRCINWITGAIFRLSHNLK